MSTGKVAQAEVFRPVQEVAFGVHLGWCVYESSCLSTSTSMHRTESIVATKAAQSLESPAAISRGASRWQEG